MVISLGKNPVSGGSPPKLRSSNDNVNILLFEYIELLIGEVNISLLHIINIGVIIMLYRVRYKIDKVGLLIIDKLYIQPICVIDDAAIIDFNFVWFNPNEEPIKAFNLEIIIIITVLVLLIINVKIAIGASFCHVDKIVHDNHDNDDITEGNQKWYGTIPSLINIDDSSINISRGFIGVLFHKAVDDINRILEPNACAKKYFSIASVSWNLSDIFINGINDSMLISKAAQVNNQLFLDIAIRVLIIRVQYKIFLIGDNLVNMKI